MSTGLSLLPLHFTLRTLTHAIHPLSFVFIYELFRQTLHITKCLPHSAHPPEHTRAKSFHGKNRTCAHVVANLPLGVNECLCRFPTVTYTGVKKRRQLTLSDCK